MKRRARAQYVIEWQGRAPTATELRALQRAIASGQIQPGQHTAAASRRRHNPETSTEHAYREFHWGRAAKRRRVALVPHAHEVYELGHLVAVEYETTKGRERATWRHVFGRPAPRLTATADGRLGPIVGGRARVTKKGIEG